MNPDLTCRMVDGALDVRGRQIRRLQPGTEAGFSRDHCWAVDPQTCASVKLTLKCRRQLTRLYGFVLGAFPEDVHVQS